MAERSSSDLDSTSTKAAGPRRGSPDKDAATPRARANAGAPDPEESAEAAAKEPEAAPILVPASSNHPRPVQSDLVAASTGIRSEPGQDHLGLVGTDGKPVDPAEVFEDTGPGLPHLTAKVRILEQYRLPGGKTTLTRLLYAKGAAVPRDIAARVQAAYTAANK